METGKQIIAVRQKCCDMGICGGLSCSPRYDCNILFLFSLLTALQPESYHLLAYHLALACTVWRQCPSALAGPTGTLRISSGGRSPHLDMDLGLQLQILEGLSIHSLSSSSSRTVLPAALRTVPSRSLPACQTPVIPSQLANFIQSSRLGLGSSVF